MYRTGHIVLRTGRHVSVLILDSKITRPQNPNTVKKCSQRGRHIAKEMGNKGRNQRRKGQIKKLQEYDKLNKTKRNKEQQLQQSKNEFTLSYLNLIVLPGRFFTLFRDSFKRAQ